MKITLSQMLCAPVANNFDECLLICAKLGFTSSVQVLSWQIHTCTFTQQPSSVDMTHLNSDDLVLSQNSDKQQLRDAY